MNRLNIEPKYNDKEQLAILSFNKFATRNDLNPNYKAVADKLNYAETYKMRSPEHKNRYQNHVNTYSTKYGVDPGLVSRVMSAENSTQNPFAVSGAGAVGLMQLTKPTYEFIGNKLRSQGVDLGYITNPEDNIHAGVFYLSYLQKKFDSPELVLAAYNAGPGNVNKWIKEYGNDWGTISKNLKYKGAFKETTNYVTKIMGNE